MLAPRDRRLLKAEKMASRRYPIRPAAATIRSRVEAGMLGWPRKAIDTVVKCTPATRATSLMVGLGSTAGLRVGWRYRSPLGTGRQASCRIEKVERL